MPHLSQCVGRFKVIFTEEPPEFLRCSRHIRNDAFTFARLLFSFCPGSLNGFDKGPIWVATGF